MFLKLIYFQLGSFHSIPKQNFFNKRKLNQASKFFFLFPSKNLPKQTQSKVFTPSEILYLSLISELFKGKIIIVSIYEFAAQFTRLLISSSNIFNHKKEEKMHEKLLRNFFKLQRHEKAPRDSVELLIELDFHTLTHKHRPLTATTFGFYLNYFNWETNEMKQATKVVKGISSFTDFRFQ